MVPRTLSGHTGEVRVGQESFSAAHRYAEIPSAFVATTVLTVLERPTGLRLRERAVATPFRKDYDLVNDPTQWPAQFDVSHWAVFAAYRGQRRVGGAVAAFDTPGVEMLEGRSDLAVLWDLRVIQEGRRERR